MNRIEWITQAARLHAAEQPFALVTVLKAQAPTSSKAGDKAVVTAHGQIHGWIGGGCAQPAVLKTVRRALLDGQPRTIRISPSDQSAERDLGDVLEFGMACHSGGTLELFIDPVMPSVTLTVVGESPVARALASLAPRVGLRVAVVAHGGTAADFPDAETVLVSDEAVCAGGQLASTPFVVVATQGRRDLQGLKAALSLQPQGLWFVASARKARVLLDALVASGEDPAAVARIVAPAGESIGAQTPEEIALSVLTSVVAARRGRLPQRHPALAMAENTAACATATRDAGNDPLPEIATSPAEPVALTASCCGGGKKATAQAAVSVPPATALAKAAPDEAMSATVAVAAVAPSSCCAS